MANLRKDIWKFGDDTYKVYIETKKALDDIIKLTKYKGSLSQYSNEGKVYAWDLVVNEKFIPKIKKILKSKG
tara:strand:- start:2775 stop:2990 length:216 start_codon:yes stop_codon:yes gene_type:complete